MDHDYTYDVTNGDSLNLEDLKEALLTHISSENKAFFKSLQINDPELSYEERKEIASDLLAKSHSKFLQRFGMSLKQNHLLFFESQSYNSIEQGEVSDHIKHIKYNLSHHGSIVRNRRYSALVKLIKDKKFFSEGEMKCRDPLLFEQLIGQYQSAEEKRINRRPDPKTDTLVDVLLKGIENDLNRDIEKKHRIEEENMLLNDDSQATSETSKPSDEENDSDPEANHEQWGNFDEPSTSTSKKARKKTPKMITAGERDLLREEFLGIMYSNFLSGKDAEFFDYSTVDDDESYDDTIETDQDCEDKYFEEDSEDSPAQQPIGVDDDSEDELDTYMKHLEKNLKNLQRAEFEEEFED